MTTYNRIDCAKINQEIIKYNYDSPLKIVHACSKEAYEGYLEDILVRCEPKPLHEGAINLIQCAIRSAVENYDSKYLVHVEADNWMLDERVIYRYIDRMEEKDDIFLCTAYWQGDDLFLSRYGLRDLFKRPKWPVLKFCKRLGYKDRRMRDFCTQFFIIKRHDPLIESILQMRPDPDIFAEEQFYRAFTKRFSMKNVLRMREREPVHPEKRYICEDLSLYCQHWPSLGTADDPRSEKDPMYVRDDLIGKKEAQLLYKQRRKGK